MIRHMNALSSISELSRRKFIGRAALGTAFSAVPGLFAETLTYTPDGTRRA